MSLEEAEKKSTESDSDDGAHMTGSMVQSSKVKKLKKFNFVTEDGRKAELIDLLGLEVVHKYYNYKLQYDRYCDKMLHRRAESRITNCDVLTRKDPITFKVYREDGTYEVIPNFKDPLNKLNDLANKKRKHVDDIHDYFKANKRLKSSVQYEDHLPGTVLNEPVLVTQAEVVQFEMLKFLQHQLFRSLEDWEVSSLQCMQRRFTRREKDCFMPKGIKQSPLEKVLLKSAEKYIRFSSKDCTWLRSKFEGDNTPIIIQPPCYSASKCDFMARGIKHVFISTSISRAVGAQNDHENAFPKLDQQVL
ncbi:hypothetical protein Tco_1198335 [Tanacetum coccineum]